MSTDNLARLVITPKTLGQAQLHRALSDLLAGFSPQGAILFGLPKSSNSLEYENFLSPERPRLPSRCPRSMLEQVDVVKS